MSVMRAYWQARRFLAALTAVAAMAHAPIVARADTVAGPDAEARLEFLAHEIAATQDPRVAEALLGIDGLGRRLLALRSYLRSSDHLAARWSWTQAEITDYKGSREHRELLAEIDKVREAFTQQNPGFALWVNPKVRGLEQQTESWNTNESVSASAAVLLAVAVEIVSAPAFPAGDVDCMRKVLVSFLTAYRPVPAPTVAAPGLSLHGHMRAVDFQVHQGDQIIAGPGAAAVATDWDAAGWSARLEAAVRAASTRFIGPLASPHEPWHFTYTPEGIAK